ncbi:MAG: transposase [Bacteroidia bacterium]|nr:transposase [Bacteroidia bacterium]
MIYTTNWIERLNRFCKRTLRMRGALPSAEAVLFLMGRVAWENPQISYARSLPLFKDWDARGEHNKNNI